MAVTNGSDKKLPQTKGKTRKDGKKGRKSAKAAGKKPAKPSYREVVAQSLPWRRVKSSGYEFDDDGGMLELEELDDVDIVWEDTAGGGRSAKFKVREDKLQQVQDEGDAQNDAAFASGEELEWTGFAKDHGDLDRARATEEEDDGPVASTSTSSASPITDKRPAVEYDSVPFDDSQLPGFSHIPLLPSLKRALHSLKFSKPSEIQEQTLSVVLSEDSGKIAGRDVVGVAETGSGKTLAYSLPILQEIFHCEHTSSTKKRALSALILCPTRELALQVRQHVGDVIYRASLLPGQTTEGVTKSTKPVPRANIVTICGGMSVQKQKRLLSSNYGVDIIVATPGRLWDLLQEDAELGKAIKGVKFLVLDEADRMIENGHFAELENIVALTKRSLPVKAGKRKAAQQEEETFVDDFENPADSVDAYPTREDIKTYVFSATMSKELQRNVKKKGKRPIIHDDERGQLGALANLIDKLDFRDDDPLVIDLSPQGGLVKSLQEVKIDCLLNEKDYYLYYFLLRYPGRTLVFLSSIDAIRRLKPLLEVLSVNVAVLHSGMQQRARLKALDRFKTATSMVLLATDVAARGLDVPAVDHVVHYQLPRTADTYVHRSGRTARAGNEGLALQLCAPEEKVTQRALMKSLGKETKLQELNVDYSLLTKIKERVDLARQIETAHHRAEKASHDENWLQQAAKDMEIDLDDDDDDSDGGRGRSKLKARKAKGQERELRERLKALLARPLMVRGISAKYLAGQGGSNLAKQMLSGSNHRTMFGLAQTRAVEDHR